MRDLTVVTTNSMLVRPRWLPLRQWAVLGSWCQGTDAKASTDRAATDNCGGVRRKLVPPVGPRYRTFSTGDR